MDFIELIKIPVLYAPNSVKKINVLQQFKMKVVQNAMMDII
jgi:hypothetical protein